MSANQEQIDYWNGDAGKTWAREQAALDGNMAKLTEPALAKAAAQPGEHVLDVGCGAGATTLRLARAVTAGGAKGQVLGADISEPLLLRARERASSSELPKDALTLVNADAAAHHFDEQAFDLVFSRFGVMFFADPVHAFKNIARGIKRSGRLVFMCWRPLVLNEWMSVPFGAVRHLLPATEPTPEGAPGPFAFADQNRVRGILTGAGFRDVTFEAADRPMGLGSTVPEAADYALTIGMLARAVREANDPSLKAKVREHLVTLFEKTATDAGVEMPAAVWLVSARPS